MLNNFLFYWRNTSSIEKFSLIKYILKFPFFLIHELSHIAITIMFNKVFVWEFYFFKKENNSDKIIIYGLDMDVYGEVDFYVALGSFIPTITYFFTLIIALSIFIFNPTLIMLIINLYIIYGYDIGICSKADMCIVKEYLKKNYIWDI